MANEIKMARAVISKRFLSISIESPLFINLRNCKAYTQPHIHNHITKHRLPRISRPQFSFSYSSSSSSSSSKVGFVGWCLAEIESRPLFTNCITSSLICTAADLTSKSAGKTRYGYNLQEAARGTGESAGDIVARLKRDLLPTLRNDLIYWPFCDFFHIQKSPCPATDAPMWIQD